MIVSIELVSSKIIDGIKVDIFSMPLKPSEIPSSSFSMLPWNGTSSGSLLLVGFWSKRVSLSSLKCISNAFIYSDFETITAGWFLSKELITKSNLVNKLSISPFIRLIKANS